ncbi:hypothetical protein ACKKBF_B32755 [Auxenochlorella protothecoides x Auxenochlorella symbiontica]
MSGSMEGASPPPQADDSDFLDAQLYLDEPGDAPHAAQEDAPRLAVKFLVPNVAAGSIIGKGGVNVSDIQAQSQARIQLSKIGEPWPGTLGEFGTPPAHDRLLLITGTLDALLTALHAVLATFRSELAALAAMAAREDGAMALRMLVHARLCGTLIGRGGATIRSFKDASGAVFNISPPPGPGDPPERVVRLTGTPDQLLRAVALVLTKLSQNPDYPLLTDVSLGFGPPAAAPAETWGGAAPPPGGGAGAFLPHAAAAAAAGVGTTSLVMAVPEDRVGVVIGRGGAVINQIKAVLGVRIRISRRGECLPGTNDRSCEISGPLESVALAQRLIQQKVEGVERE